MDDANRIEIFRPGTFTSVEGQTVSYSQADLAAIAAAYDPAVFESPLVVGHPKMDDPAYGWVDRLEMDGDRLVAIPKQVEPAFGDLVASGRFKKTSAQLYPADHPFNPKPGAPYLKHVGFLGAAAPAVKGLKSLSFSEEQVVGTVTIDIPREEPAVAEPKPKTAEELSFAERETALTERETALAERERAAAARAKADRHAASLSFAEGLVTAGKLAPAGKAKVVGLLDELAALETASFGEGDGKVEMTPAAAFRSLFDTATPIVSFGEFAPRDEALTGDDADPEALASRAMSYAEEQRKAGRIITITQAVRHVSKQGAK